MKKPNMPSTRGMRAAFLANYAQTGNVTEACRRAGVPRSQHYRWLEDDDYAAAYDVAHAEACDALESEARRRAVEGVLEPVIFKGTPARQAVYDKAGKPKRDAKTGEPITEPVLIRRYSDRLLELLLKAHKPDKYRDNFKGELIVPRSGSVDLSGLTAAELDTLDAIARRLQSSKPPPAEDLPKAA